MKTTLSLLLNAASERDLNCLLIGGNAVVLLGVPRMTIDIDLLVPNAKRSQWLDLMRQLGFIFLHGTDGFAQFRAGTQGMAPVDLIFVDDPTWTMLAAESRPITLAKQTVRIPRPEHLIALKLHAISSPNRETREQDWADIRHIVRACRFDPADAHFREIIVRFGGAPAMDRILGFLNEP